MSKENNIENTKQKNIENNNIIKSENQSESQKSKKQLKKERRAEKKALRRIRRGKDDLYYEVRKVLLNQIELDEDGRFITTTEPRITLWGSADGESKVRFLGVSRKNYYYSSELSNTKAIFRAKKSMMNIGRGLNLRCDTEAAACIVKTYIFYPVVMAFFENENGDIELSLFTPRTFSSFLAIKLAALKFERASEGMLDKNGSDASFIDRLREARYQRKLEKEKAKKEKLENSGYREDINDSNEVSIFDIDWSSDEDEITEDDLIPEEDMPKQEEEDE